MSWNISQLENNLTADPLDEYQLAVQVMNNLSTSAEFEPANIFGLEVSTLLLDQGWLYIYSIYMPTSWRRGKETGILPH